MRMLLDWCFVLIIFMLVIFHDVANLTCLICHIISRCCFSSLRLVVQLHYYPNTTTCSAFIILYFRMCSPIFLFRTHVKKITQKIYTTFKRIIGIFKSVALFIMTFLNPPFLSDMMTGKTISP